MSNDSDLQVMKISEATSPLLIYLFKMFAIINTEPQSNMRYRYLVSSCSGVNTSQLGRSRSLLI